MGRYRKKPVEVEAEQYNGPEYVSLDVYTANRPPLPDGARWLPSFGGVAAPYVGDYRLAPGDWVVRNEHGWYERCQGWIFAATYEPVPVPPGDGAGA